MRERSFAASVRGILGAPRSREHDLMNPDKKPRSGAEARNLPADSSPPPSREAAVALAELGRLQKARKLSPETAMRLAIEAAAAFLERLDASGGY